jgi:hypothetical protein
MKKKHFLLLSLILFIAFKLTACYYMPLSSKPINYETMSGNFIKTNSDTITREYRIKVTSGFSALIDFDITMGQVDWEIIDPEGEIAFAGYVVNDGADFSSLKFESNSSSGTYKLNLKPKAAEVSYKVVWRDRLERK